MVPMTQGGAGKGPRILVLDVGSSSTRCRLFDLEGRAVDLGDSARVLYRWDEDGGSMCIDADELLGHVAAAVDVALEQVRREGGEIAAVAVTTFWHSLLGIDAEGSPVTPLTGWGDARAWPAVRALAERVDRRSLHARTGCPLHPSYPLGRLAWLRVEEPASFAAAAAWVSFGEYMEERLFGERRCSLSMASGTGLLDVHRLCWDGEALGLAGISPEMLSPLVDFHQPVRGLREKYARRWPELATVPWYPALGDGACASLGSGAVMSEGVSVTIGTSAAVRLLFPASRGFEVPEGLWGYRLDGSTWVVGGALSNGGNALRFLQRALRLEPGGWDTVLASAGPGDHGLTVLPELKQERDPTRLGLHGGAVVGLRLESEPHELALAWVEAICYRLADLCDRLGALFDPAPRAIASGGALHGSAIWSQTLADVLGRPVVVRAEREETSRGAALMVLRALGREPVGGFPHPPTRQTYEPRLERRRRHEEGRRRQAELSQSLSHAVARADVRAAAEPSKAPSGEIE